LPGLARQQQPSDRLQYHADKSSLLYCGPDADTFQGFCCLKCIFIMPRYNWTGGIIVMLYK
jgi:hypothetical protein